jgi:hypothetical protein
MSCNIRRWANHAMSAPSKHPETGATKEFNDRLAQMQQERIRQDAMWEEPPAALVTTTQPTQATTQLLTSTKRNDPQTKK